MARTNLNPQIESAPAVDVDGTVYIGVKYYTTIPTGRVAAMVPGTNGTLTKRGEFDPKSDYSDFEASPMLGDDGTLYIGSMNGVFYFVDKATLQSRWSYDTNLLLASATDYTYIHSTAALSRDGKTVYVGVGAFQTAWGAICAFSTSGRLLWSKKVDGAVESSPAVADDGTLYFGTLSNTVYAFDAQGNEKWQRKLSDQILGSAAIGGDGTIYIGSQQELVALSPANALKWSHRMSVPGSPVVGPDGKIFVANFGDGLLYALDPQTGDTVWKKPGAPMIGSTPVVRADNTVIFGANDADGSTVRAYDGEKGDLLWSRGSTGGLQSSAVISPAADHAIFIGSNDGYLYWFGGNEYGVSRYASWPMFQHDPAHTARAPDASVNSRLINLSARGPVGPGRALIGGYALKGPGSKRLLVRAVGPTLKSLGVPSALPDPKLAIHVANAYIVPNDNWSDGEDANAIAAVSPTVGAFDLSWGSKDSALLPTATQLDGLNYTGVVDTADGQPGIALFEIYDTDQGNPDSRLVNLSTRGHVGTGDDILIAGLYVGGTGKQRLLVRAVGPTLAQSPFLVTGVLQQPILSMYSADRVVSNTGWTTDGWKADLVVAAKIGGAFPLANNSTDSAMIVTLSPGLYTFQVTGVGGTTGEALVEVYALPY